jgi:hypothetical protein
MLVEQRRLVMRGRRARSILAVWTIALLLAIGSYGSGKAAAVRPVVRLSRAEYRDRVEAAWTAQILACIMGWPYEHQTASTQWIDRFPKPYTSAPVDDDWYYEMVAVRAFEKHGIGLSVEQLGEQWSANACGSWGSSEQARLLLLRGVKPPDTGHPRYNKLWFTIGPQFSGDVYGLIAPGLPNVAGGLARKLGHINGYAEGVDGAVFMAGMNSLAFSERDTREIVRKAARLVDPQSPYRQCLDLVISMAERGRTPAEITDAVEDRWHIEYPATNNAVANGGIAAMAVWFGKGDFLKTVNLAYTAGDFTDADCNAANAASVVGAMKGMKALPADLVSQLRDRIVGSEMGGVKLTPPVDERISELAKRTATIGEKVVGAHGGRIEAESLTWAAEEPVTQRAELFKLADLTQYWDSAWKLERAGFGGAGGGLGGIRGITHLNGDILATYPRDEVRGLVLRRTVLLGRQPRLLLPVAADAGRAWQLEVFCNDKRLVSRLVEGGSEGKEWVEVPVDLSPYAGQSVQLRLYQRVLLPNKLPGNAYWRRPVIE